ncbi:MAG TPA: type IV pilus assembly protein PilM [Solirubrobacterales bacterium]|nr:type IV pilus assembly protein PilM [Solirubrobacterales bacterium]
MKLSLKKPTLSLGSKRKGDSALVGLEIEAGNVAAAEIHTNGETRVSAVAVQPLPAGAFDDGEVVAPDAVAEALRSLFSSHNLSKRVRLGIANQRVVVRTIRLPAIEDPTELDSAVRFTAQEQIAMPLDQAVLDHRVVGGVTGADGGPPQIDVIVVAARRDMIAAALKPLLDAGLEPVGVDLSAFAMIRALAPTQLAAPADDSGAQTAAILYCNLGEVSNLAVAKGHSCLFTRVSPIGLDDIAASLGAKTNLSPEHALMWLQHVGLESPLEAIEGDPTIVAEARSALETGAASLLDEIRLSLDFYGTQEAAVPVERIVVCGPGSAVPGLTEYMEPALGLPIATGTPAALADLDASSAARLTLPYGLALDQ